MIPTGANTDFLPEAEFFCGNWKDVVHVICIPASNEISLLPVLNSLNQCHSRAGVGVVICINSSETADQGIEQTNIRAFDELRNVTENKYWFPLHGMLHANLPAKKAGVGLARKLAMDKAVTLLEERRKEGLLLCLDADCLVEECWVESIINYFNTNPKKVAASVYFEHPLPEDELLREGIMQYELHLRYLKQALQWAGYPWYYHTVGSSMALRAETYVKSGGMNTRQAGEDFYFLHKLMPLGFGEINTTTVYPAARYSDRVPFGTGRSMLEFAQNSNVLTYNFDIFKELKLLFDIAFEDGFEWDKTCGETLKTILKDEGIEAAIKDALEHSANDAMAINRFKKWFSGFRIIRIMHALRDKGLADQPVNGEAGKLLESMKLIDEPDSLRKYRELDRGLRDGEIR